MRPIETPVNPQTFCDGLAVFYRTKNSAGKGNLPKQALEEFVRVPFAEKKVGDIRYYAALQADSKISKVIRIPRVRGLQPAGDIVLISGDTRQYKVQKTAVNSLTVPASIDVTLEISKQIYLLEGGNDSTGI